MHSGLANEIVCFSTVLCNKGFGVNWTDIKFIAYKYATDERNKHKVPGFVASWGWLRCFQQRHPELTQRVAENLDRQRAGALNPEVIQYYFILLAAVRELK